MVFELLSWILITVVCYGWGQWTRAVGFRHGPQPRETSVAVDCLLGLTSIGLISLFLSLLLPQGRWTRLLFLLPPLVPLLFSKQFRGGFTERCARDYAAMTGPARWLALACAVTVLFISSSEIIHPDTLNYHQFSVRIFAQYGSIRGIANTRADFGFQSTWFAALNIFNGSLVTGTFSFPLSGCVTIWFIAFLSALPTPGPENGEHRHGKNKTWAAVLLLLAMLSWTQIRLTAASASPDFIAAIYVLAAFYFFAGRPAPSRGDDFLAGFFAGGAMLTKASALPVALIPLFLFLRLVRQGNRTGALRLATTGVLFSFPLLLRSYLATGYLLFPSTLFDFFRPDWKVPGPAVRHLVRYITAYARFPVRSDQTEPAIALPFREWSSLWWTHLYAMDKLLIVVVIMGGIFQAMLLRRWLAGAGLRMRLGWTVAAVGSVFWFLLAPDPRFGAGFLMALGAFQFAPLFGKTTARQEDRALGTKLLRTTQYMGALAIAGYALYRAYTFFTPGQWTIPQGISTAAPVSPDCTDYVKKMLFPALEDIGPLPDSCKTFQLRGKTVADGFRPPAP